MVNVIIKNFTSGNHSAYISGCLFSGNTTSPYLLSVPPRQNMPTFSGIRLDSVGNLSQIEFGAGAVAFYYAVHLCFLRLYNKLFIVPCSMAGAHACGAFLAYHNIVALSTEKSTTYCVSAF